MKDVQLVPGETAPIATGRGAASVAFTNVLIVVRRDDATEVDFGDAVPGESGIDSGTDWVSIRSSWESHDAEFCMELWSSDQPLGASPTGDWEASFEAQMTVDGPTLRDQRIFTATHSVA